MHMYERFRRWWWTKFRSIFSHDEGSDVDTTDISTGGASPSSGPMAFYGDEIDEIWRSHINKIMYDNSGVHTGNTYHLFARLFHETRRKLSTFTKEACYFLAKADNLRSVAAQLCILFLRMSLILTHLLHRESGHDLK